MKRQLGQSMVETALVLPFVLLLVFGIFELGRIVFVFSAVNNASREAARFGTATGATGGGGVPRYLNCNSIRQAAIDTAFLAALTPDDIAIEYDTPVGGTMQIYGECDGGTPEFVGTDDIIEAGDVSAGDRIVITINRQINPILSIFPSFNPEFVTARTILKDIAIGPPECSDGADNDGDGATDYPDDSGCSSADDTIEAVCYRLSVVASPAEGGTMSLNPSTNCANRYIEDTIVNLEAFADLRNDTHLLPRPDFTFDHWAGPVDDGDGTQLNPTTVTMDTDKDITAHFRPVDADLRVLKSQSENPVGADKPFYYTIDVHNLGPDSAYQIVITDTLPSPPELTYVRWRSDDGITCDETHLSETPPLLVCNLEWLEVGENAIVYIDVQSGVVNGGPQPIENTVIVSATESDPDTANSTMTVPGTIEPRAELWIEKEGPSGIIWADTQFDYTIRVHNDGPSDATGVTVIDYLPEQVEYVTSAYPAAGDCDYNGSLHTVECDISSLPAGNVATITISVRAPEEEPADAVENIATVTADETEDDTSDNTTAPVDSDIESHADLSIEKLAPPSVARDDAFEYSLTVTNNGPSLAPNVTVVDTLPPGVNFISELDGVCSEASGIVTCNLGSMTDGETRQVLLTVEATQDTEGSPPLQNTAEVSSDIDDLQEGDNVDTADTDVFIDIQLTVDKSATTGTVTEGQVFSYVIEVGNTGASTATGVELTDTLPDSVAFEEILDNGGWACNTAGSPVTITCSPADGILRSGDSTTITIEVSAISGGDATNTATLDSTETGPVSDSAGPNIEEPTPTPTATPTGTPEATPTSTPTATPTSTPTSSASLDATHDTQTVTSGQHTVFRLLNQLTARLLGFVHTITP